MHRAAADNLSCHLVTGGLLPRTGNRSGGLASLQVGNTKWRGYTSNLSSRHRPLRLPQRRPMSEPGTALVRPAIPGAILDPEKREAWRAVLKKSSFPPIFWLRLNSALTGQQSPLLRQPQNLPGCRQQPCRKPDDRCSRWHENQPSGTR